MKVIVGVLLFALLLVSSVSASTLSTGDSSSSSGGSDYNPPSSSGAGGSSSKKVCLTQWVTYDGGKSWEKRDVIITKGDKKSIIDGNKCKMNQPLGQARAMYKSFFKPLYERKGAIEQNLVWLEDSSNK